jgi:hypothetical protein
MADAKELEALRAELAYRRQKRDLYRARMYGQRPARPARMRELDRLVAQAAARLQHASGRPRPPKPA